MTTSPPDAPGAPPIGRAGRNLPMAITVGALLGAAVIVTLYAYRPAFVGLVIVAIGCGCYEMARVLAQATGRQLPLVPLVLGMGATYVAAYQRGSQALSVGLLLTAVAMIAWRVLDGGPESSVRQDLAASLWVLCYVVLLAGFAILMAGEPDGARRATTFVATVVCSDVGGYAAGVLFGKHPLAPKVSPKKSWEGLAGSAAACAVGGGLLVSLALHGAWWQGVVFGLAVVVTATVGDLGESLIKRDLGVKDMGTLLPGHGGIMDRLDSLLLTAPVAYLLLGAFVPS